MKTFEVLKKDWLGIFKSRFSKQGVGKIRVSGSRHKMPIADEKLFDKNICWPDPKNKNSVLLTETPYKLIG